jgi:hypothetical protein
MTLLLRPSRYQMTGHTDRLLQAISLAECFRIGELLSLTSQPCLEKRGLPTSSARYLTDRIRRRAVVSIRNVFGTATVSW